MMNYLVNIVKSVAGAAHRLLVLLLGMTTSRREKAPDVVAQADPVCPDPPNCGTWPVNPTGPSNAVGPAVLRSSGATHALGTSTG